MYAPKHSRFHWPSIPATGSFPIPFLWTREVGECHSPSCPVTPLVQASFDTHTRVGTLEWLNSANLGGEGVLKLTASSSLDRSDIGKKMPVRARMRARARVCMCVCVCLSVHTTLVASRVYFLVRTSHHNNTTFGSVQLGDPWTWARRCR